MTKEILIVGAGPVGLSAALELARRGFRPHIIDKATGPAPLNESRALAIHLRTIDILRPSGVSEQLLAASNKVKRVEIYYDGHKQAELNLTEHPRSDHGILSLPQGETERILMAALKGYDIEPQWQSELIGLQDFEARPVATFTAPQGQEHSIRYDIVIGCDGAHSNTRKLAGIAFTGKQMKSVWSLADIETKAPDHGDTARIDMRANGQVCGAIPINDHLRRYVTSSPNVMDFVPSAEKIQSIPWQSDFTISFRLVESFQRGNVFLAGDAAHIHSPAGGRGMNLGIEDAAWLAWLISENNTGIYDAKRRPVAKFTLKQTFQQTRQVTNNSAIGTFIRRVLPKILLSFGFIRRRALTTILALDTPPPPWLEKKD